MELQSNPASLAGFTTQGSATVGEFLPGTALGMTCEVVVSGRPGQIADLRRKCREAAAHWLSAVNGTHALCNFSREARTAVATVATPGAQVPSPLSGGLSS